jgi:transcriptional regulator with XRE-family HTH domain
MTSDNRPRDVASVRSARTPRSGRRAAAVVTGGSSTPGKQPKAEARSRKGTVGDAGAAAADLGRSLGPVMRQARKRQQLTLEQVAKRAELSVSYLSQIERNLLTPSVGTLKRIAGALGIAAGQLIAPDANGARTMVAVLRKDQRKRVTFPQSSICYELLMPDFRRRASALWLIAKPGAESGPDQTHEGEDIVIVLQGGLSVDVAGTWYELAAGDSICFNSELPHRWCNRGRKVAKAIWISSPAYL